MEFDVSPTALSAFNLKEKFLADKSGLKADR
jgi:hypothetical protein